MGYTDRMGCITEEAQCKTKMQGLCFKNDQDPHGAADDDGGHVEPLEGQALR